MNDRTLINARVLVGAFELDQRVDIGGYFARDRAVNVMIGFDDDALGIDVIDGAIAARNYNRA